MKLSTEQLARLSRLLDEVVDLDEAGRRAWLQTLAPEHADLEPALRHGLLPSTDPAARGDPFAALEKIGAAEGTVGGGALYAGELVGPYRLMRPLGSGGMAEVWLAERADGAFKREVALKVPVGLTRRQDLAPRFMIERDILAALEHPRIARFYDAGVSQEGRPYLALEYVAGENLLKWADEHRLGIRERIELLLQVLEAVAYAHERGVLHRDIKPSNVLVTDAGQVTLLDFGVAKITQSAEDADLTLMYGRALTPAYASPEQMKGEGGIDAASDVYSLGVVLYELLCGHRPYEVAGKSVEPVQAALPPSTRLDAAAAIVRGGRVVRIRRVLKGDLDAIALKALAPAPAQRYDSPAAMARDLRRFLAGEPVHAIPGSLHYRARKFLVRNRLGAGVTVVLAAVFAGLVYRLLVTSPAPAAVPPAAVATVAPAAPAVTEDKSIAVLPFADQSEQRDQQHFADGLSEGVIDRLTRSPHLRVIARTSAFAFKGRNDDLRAIASTLGVAYVVVGSVRKSGTALRVTAQLVRASDGSSVWSQTYDRTLADTFKVQDEIAGTVAHALAAVLDRDAGRAPREPNVEAYALVLQGDIYTNGPFKRDAERAEVLYKKAIALDPTYALPWAKLGLLYMKQARLAWMPKDEGNAQARRAIDTALQIDPVLMAAHAARFRYLVRVDHRWADARVELNRMRAIDLNDAVLPDCEAYFASVTGKLDEAIKIQGQIVERDPLNSAAIGTLAFYLLQGDRFEEALVFFRRELEMNPHAIENQSLMGVALALLGRGKEALAVIGAEPHEGYRLWALSIAHWIAGRHDESDAALKLLTERFPQASAYYIAQIYALREKKSPAFDWLNRACSERQTGCELVRIDRFFRALHDDPRYKALLVKMKLDGDLAAATR